MRSIAAMLITTFTFVAFIFLEVRYDNVQGTEDIHRDWPVWLIPLLLSVATFFGVIARSVYEVVTKPNPPKTYRAIIGEAVGPNRMLLALVISPVVIGLFYKTIRSTDDVTFTIVSAFQNGFFWKSILRRR